MYVYPDISRPFIENAVLQQLYGHKSQIKNSKKTLDFYFPLQEDSLSNIFSRLQNEKIFDLHDIGKSDFNDLKKIRKKINSIITNYYTCRRPFKLFHPSKTTYLVPNSNTSISKTKLKQLTEIFKKHKPILNNLCIAYNISTNTDQQKNIAQLGDWIIQDLQEFLKTEEFDQNSFSSLSKFFF